MFYKEKSEGRITHKRREELSIYQIEREIKRKEESSESERERKRKEESYGEEGKYLTIKVFSFFCYIVMQTVERTRKII